MEEGTKCSFLTCLAWRLTKKKNPTNKQLFYYFILAPLGHHHDTLTQKEFLVLIIFTLIFAKKLQRKCEKPTINWASSRLRHASNRNSTFPLNKKILQNNPKGNASLVNRSQCIRSRNEHIKKLTQQLISLCQLVGMQICQAKPHSKHDEKLHIIQI